MSLGRYKSNMLPVHQVGPVRAHKTEWFQQEGEILQYFGSHQPGFIGEIDPRIVAAGFQPDDLFRIQVTMSFRGGDRYTGKHTTGFKGMKLKRVLLFCISDHDFNIPVQDIGGITGLGDYGDHPIYNMIVVFITGSR